jgi:hypothetical protein
LVLYRLTTDPGLPQLNLTVATPAVGDLVTFISDGDAATPASPELHWNVTGTPPNLVWTPVPSGGNYSGYHQNVQQKMWGTNYVENDLIYDAAETDPDHSVVLEIDHQSTITFLTEFDKAGITEGPVTDSEAQGLNGDSGGAVFAKIGSAWVLVGITSAIGIFDNQPDPGQTAVYGNLTFAVDLARYSAEINAITGIPETSSFWLLGGVTVLVSVCGALLRRRAMCVVSHSGGAPLCPLND